MNTNKLYWTIQLHNYDWSMMENWNQRETQRKNEIILNEVIPTLSIEDAKEIYNKLKDHTKTSRFGLMLKARIEELSPKSELSKIMSTAWDLFRSEVFTSFPQALKAAWKKYRLLQRLKNGIARFSFTKSDGSKREAIGTLRNGNFQYETKGTTKKPSPANVVKYFDIVSNAWRSCRIDRLIEIAA